MTKRWMGAVLLIFACVGSRGLLAQTDSEKAEITGIAHFAFRSSDLDREVAFLGKLGFEESFTNVADGKVSQAFIKVNDKQFIEVYPQTDPKQPLGWMHVCYESASLKNLNALYVARGLKPTPVRTAAAGNLLFSVIDPDGREIEFTQYMPGSRQTNDRGQHIGAGRVSDQLVGFEAPVKDMSVAKTFASALGFDEEKQGQNVRLTIPADQDLTIVLEPAGKTAALQFLLPVEDAKKTADELRDAGLKVERRDKLVFVRDPDGNTFVLMESEKASHRSRIPFRHKSED